MNVSKPEDDLWIHTRTDMNHSPDRIVCPAASSEDKGQVLAKGKAQDGGLSTCPTLDDESLLNERRFELNET